MLPGIVFAHFTRVFSEVHAKGEPDRHALVQGGFEERVGVSFWEAVQDPADEADSDGQQCGLGDAR